MRWDAWLDDGKGELTFGRPIRWLLFLYGGRVVPFDIRRTDAAQAPLVQEVRSGAMTYGHRFLTTSGRAGRAVKVKTFDEYKARLLEHFVLLEREERRERIARELDVHAGRLGGRVHRAAAASGRPGRRSPRSRRMAFGRPRHLLRGVPLASRGSAHDDDDPPSALLPGGGRSRKAEAGVPCRDQRRGRAAGAHQPQLGTRADGPVARRAVLLRAPTGR